MKTNIITFQEAGQRAILASLNRLFREIPVTENGKEILKILKEMDKCKPS